MLKSKCLHREQSGCSQKHVNVKAKFYIADLHLVTSVKMARLKLVSNFSQLLEIQKYPVCCIDK